MNAQMREQILRGGRAPAPRKAVEVPFWGLTVYVGRMSGFHRDSFDSENYAAQKKTGGVPNIRARFLSRCLFDAADGGALIFDPDGNDPTSFGKATPDDVLDLLYKAAVEVNGASPEAVKAISGESPADLSGSSSSN